MNILQILLDSPKSSLGDDNCLDVTDATLDLIWTHIVKNTDNFSMLMSDVVNGDAQVDRLQIALAAECTAHHAALLCARLRELFRKFAYDMAEVLEVDVRDAVLFDPSNI